MILIVRKASTLTLSEQATMGMIGIPQDWPIESLPYDDGQSMPYGFVPMTTEEMDELKSNNQVAYDIWLTQKIPTLTQLETLELSSVKYINFGTGLYSEILRKTWAFNTLLKIQNNPLTTQQMQSLMATSDLLEKCLKSGSLLTAMDVINALKTALPQYIDIADYALERISTFLSTP